MKDILDKIPNMRALVVGDIMLDCYVWGDSSRISPEAPVPVVEISKDTYTAGGAANVALNVKSLGADVDVCGWIGDDEPGARLVSLLDAAGVGFRKEFITSRVPTIQKTRVIVQRQQLCRLDREASPDVYQLDSDDMLQALVETMPEYDVVIFADYAKGFLNNNIVTKLAAAGQAAGKLVALDPKPKHILAFDGIDVVTPNRGEALQLADIHLDRHSPFPADDVCRAIWEKHHPKHLVITLGEEGMLLSEQGDVGQSIPTAAREVFDVSGAGDTVVAALPLALATGAALVDAAHFANAAAGVVVGKLGTATATPEEILSGQ